MKLGVRPMVKEIPSTSLHDQEPYGVDYHKQRVIDAAHDLKELIGYRNIWYFLLGLANEFFDPMIESKAVKGECPTCHK